MTKMLIALIVSTASACANLPADDSILLDAMRFGKSIPVTNGLGNCENVAEALQNRHGGTIVYFRHPRMPYSHAALLMDDEETLYDNGWFGYQTTWTDVMNEGWRMDYWRP